jgi:hypothetical protein
VHGSNANVSDAGTDDLPSHNGVSEASASQVVPSAGLSTDALPDDSELS